MVMTIGISALIGAALGLRFNVFVLIPTIILGHSSSERTPSLVCSLYLLSYWSPRHFKLII